MMSQNFLKKVCKPCEGVDSPLKKSDAIKNLKQISGWKLATNAKGIFREYELKNFMAAVRFINHIAQVAEKENHHPDIHLTSYRKLRVDLSTHAIGGLSENDFIVAAKINELPVELKPKK